MDEVVESLQDVARELRDAVDELRGLNRRLDQVSDGLFYLNLHLGAEVSPWTGKSAGAPAPTSGAGTMHGVVKWYDTSKGFGFVQLRDGSPDVFVHHSVVPSPGYLDDGQAVIVEAMNGEHGPMAVSLTIV